MTATHTVAATHTYTNTTAVVSVEATAEMGHRLHSWKTKCNRLHGHSWTFRVFVKGAPDERGIVEDFTRLKGDLKHVIDTALDHYTLIHKDDPLAVHLASVDGVRVVPFEPTSENLAAWLHEQFLVDNDDENFAIAIEVEETATSRARVGF